MSRTPSYFSVFTLVSWFASRFLRVYIGYSYVAGVVVVPCVVRCFLSKGHGSLVFCGVNRRFRFFVAGFSQYSIGLRSVY